MYLDDYSTLIYYYTEIVQELKVLGGPGKTEHEVLEEQQRIMEEARQKYRPRTQGLRLMSSSLDDSSGQRHSAAPPQNLSASYHESTGSAGVNPVYEYKYNRSRGELICI